MLKRARGPRPTYFDDPQLDRLLNIVVALAAETAVTRERLDTHERLLEQRGVLTRADVESFRAEGLAEAERERLREEFTERVLRTLFEEAEALEPRGDQHDYERVVHSVS
jgi:hypothetical protein